MKKHYLSIATTLLLLCTGCGNSAISSYSSTNESASTMQEIITEEMASEITTSEELSVITDVNSVAQMLIEQNLITGDSTPVYVEMIGAVNGIKYEDQGVEIYEYDTSSNAYKTLKAGGEVPLEGMDGYTVGADAINEKFVLIFSNEKDQAIIDAFESLDIEQ